MLRVLVGIGDFLVGADIPNAANRVVTAKLTAKLTSKPAFRSVHAFDNHSVRGKRIVCAYSTICIDEHYANSTEMAMTSKILWRIKYLQPREVSKCLRGGHLGSRSSLAFRFTQTLAQLKVGTVSSHPVK